MMWSDSDAGADAEIMTKSGELDDVERSPGCRASRQIIGVIATCLMRGRSGDQTVRFTPFGL
jgi:hypothetical protein